MKMQTAIVTETCPCGASITVEDWFPSFIERRLATFRVAHATCRTLREDVEAVGAHFGRSDAVQPGSQP